jgi:hypothetical protein
VGFDVDGKVPGKDLPVCRANGTLPHAEVFAVPEAYFEEGGYMRLEKSQALALEAVRRRRRGWQAFGGRFFLLVAAYSGHCRLGVTNGRGLGIYSARPGAAKHLLFTQKESLKQ